MIRSCWSTWWTPCRRSWGHEDAPVGRKRPAKLHGDKGYDYPRCRRALRWRGICPRIARRGLESSQRLGRHRWKVERSLAWLLANRRLTVRYERHADTLTALLHLACALLCARRLRPL
jgi:IS5 family transposase